jgi:hypothetical protein
MIGIGDWGLGIPHGTTFVLAALEWCRALELDARPSRVRGYNCSRGIRPDYTRAAAGRAASPRVWLGREGGPVPMRLNVPTRLNVPIGCALHGLAWLPVAVAVLVRRSPPYAEGQATPHTLWWWGDATKKLNGTETVRGIRCAELDRSTAVYKTEIYCTCCPEVNSHTIHTSWTIMGAWRQSSVRS